MGRGNHLNGFPPKIWGPGLWKFIHMAALNYPHRPSPGQKQHYRNFFESLTCVLPCGACRKHYGRMVGGRGPLRLTRARLESRAALFAYTVRLHHAVGARLAKDDGEAPPRCNARQWKAHYESMRVVSERGGRANLEARRARSAAPASRRRSRPLPFFLGI